MRTDHPIPHKHPDGADGAPRLDRRTLLQALFPHGNSREVQPLNGGLVLSDADDAFDDHHDDDDD